MSLIQARISLTQTVLGLVAGLIVAILQYVGLSSLVALPVGTTSLANILSWASTLVVTLVILLLSDIVKSMKGTWIAAIAIAAVAAGAVLALKYDGYASDRVVTVSCGDAEAETFITPERPSPDLAPIIVTHVYIERALCDEADPSVVKLLINQENDAEVRRLIMLLVFSQLLIVTGILLVAWRIVLTDQPGPAVSPSTG